MKKKLKWDVHDEIEVREAGQAVPSPTGSGCAPSCKLRGFTRCASEITVTRFFKGGEAANVT